MPTENYSHMVMEMEHMVDGDGLGDDGGEDGIEIPLSGVEGRTNLIPEMKIVVATALWFTKDSVPLGRRVFGVYKGVYERKEATLEGQTGPTHTTRVSGHVGPLLGASSTFWPMSLACVTCFP
jgi:hypothetical protein